MNRSLKSEKKIVLPVLMILMICAMILGSLSVHASAETDTSRIAVNNILVEFNQPPILADGALLASFRPIANAIGAEVSWDSATRTSTIIWDYIVVELQVGNINMAVTIGEEEAHSVELPTFSRIINGELFVPTGAVARALRLFVYWDGEERVQHINYIMEWLDGVYIGEFVNNEPHGIGTFIWDNGDIYSGEWHNGQFHGMGTFIWDTGYMYTGEWHNGQFHGWGTLMSADGNMYTGEFVNGARHGWGTFTWGPGEWYGDTYEGYFVNGVRHGRGTYTAANGGIYTGEFADGLPHGRGTFTWGPGERYGDIHEGYFANGFMHGWGKLTFADGTVLEGEWAYDDFLGE